MNHRTKMILRCAGAAAAVVALTGGIAYAMHDAPKHQVVADPSGPTPIDPSAVDVTTTTDAPTTTTRAPTTTDAPTTVATLPPVTIDTTPDTAAPETTPTAPALVCINSTNPACGPFSWASPPASRTPMSLTVAATATAQHVDFHAVVHDDQAAIDHDCVTVDFGDGVGQPASCAILDCAAPFGAWAPPSTAPDDYVRDFAHDYAVPGSYTATFTFQTAPACANNPYTNTVSRAVAVSVG